MSVSAIKPNLCRNGHDRNVVGTAKDGKCRECRRAYARRWYAANPEKRAESSKRWHTANSVKAAATRRRWYAANREKQVERNRRWRAANREKLLMKQYGLTLDELRAIMAPGCCTICGRGVEAGLGIDHCHMSGKVRGVLCKRCNMGIGMLGDDPARLRDAANYLDGGQ